MADRYPLFIANRNRLYENTKKILDLCRPYGVQLTAVTKGFNSIPECCQTLYETGCINIASSRVEQLREVKAFNASISTMLIRIPMFSEIPAVVCFADSSLVSEVETLCRLNEEAGHQRKLHRVILMRDLGDLREGFFSGEDLLEAALLVENKLPNLELYGIGTNLNCYGSVLPTYTNLSELGFCAGEIEKRIWRKLEIVSGGATTTLPVLLRGEVPPEINHLRLGECLYAPPTAWDFDLEGMRRDVFQIQAQIVELNSKPTFPIGERGKASFGKIRQYTDSGIRKRAIVALGNQDMGDAAGVLRPQDAQIKVLGASGDHTILDIEDCRTQYRLGDIITFNMLYQGCIYSSMSPTVFRTVV